MKKLKAILALFAITVASATGNASKLQGVTDKEIKLGTITLLSGEFAFYGQINQVIDAYFKKINAEEGGVHGRKIKYIIEDSGNSVPKAVEIANRLINREKVMGFLMSQGELNMTTHKIIGNKKVYDFFIGDNMSTYTPYETLYVQVPTWKQEGQINAEFIAKNYAGKKIGFIYVNAAHGKESLDSVQSNLKGKLTFGPAEPVDYDAVNGDAQVLNLMKAKVDVVYMHHDPPVSNAIIKFAHEKGFKPKWIVSSYNVNDEFINLASKEAAEGVVGSYFFKHVSNTSDPAVKKHIEFLKKYAPGIEPQEGITNWGEATGQMMVELLKRAGKDLTRESIKKAGESFKDWKCDLCIEPANTGPGDRQFISTMRQFVVKNGKWVQL